MLMMAMSAWNAETIFFPSVFELLSSKTRAKPGMAGFGFSFRSAYSWFRAKKVTSGPISGSTSSWKFFPKS